MKQYTPMVGRALRLRLTLTDASLMLRDHSAYIQDLKAKLAARNFTPTDAQYEAVFATLNEVETNLIRLTTVLDQASTQERTQ